MLRWSGQNANQKVGPDKMPTMEKKSRTKCQPRLAFCPVGILSGWHLVHTPSRPDNENVDYIIKTQNYLSHQVTCFVALMSLDMERQRNNRFDIVCCVKGKKGDSKPVEGVLYR